MDFTFIQIVPKNSQVINISAINFQRIAIALYSDCPTADMCTALYQTHAIKYCSRSYTFFIYKLYWKSFHFLALVINMIVRLCCYAKPRQKYEKCRNNEAIFFRIM